MTDRLRKRLAQLRAYLKQPAFEGVMLRRGEIADIVQLCDEASAAQLAALDAAREKVIVTVTPHGAGP